MKGLQPVLIGNLLFFGALTGIAALMGFTGEYEWVFWLVTWGVSGLLLARKLSSAFFINGFVLGFADMVLATVMQVAALRTFLENNPARGERLLQTVQGGNPSVYLLSLSLLTGVISGLVLGFVTLGFARLMKKRG